MLHYSTLQCVVARLRYHNTIVDHCRHENIYFDVSCTSSVYFFILCRIIVHTHIIRSLISCRFLFLIIKRTLLSVLYSNTSFKNFRSKLYQEHSNLNLQLVRVHYGASVSPPATLCRLNLFISCRPILSATFVATDMSPAPGVKVSRFIYFFQQATIL